MGGAGYLYWLLCCSLACVGFALGGWRLRACLLAFCTVLTVDSVRTAGMAYREAVALDPLLNGGFLAVVAVSMVLEPRRYKAILVASLLCQLGLHALFDARLISPYAHAAANNLLWLTQAGALGWRVWLEVRETLRPIG